VIRRKKDKSRKSTLPGKDKMDNEYLHITKAILGINKPICFYQKGFMQLTRRIFVVANAEREAAK
jgi:hypothetical protein